MWKLMQGIVSFRERMLPKYAKRFRQLAKGQTPDTLFISCSDSRMVPSLVTSASPGDLFVVRNVGNLIPPATIDGVSTGDLSEASAIEYAVLVLKVGHIIVCGHSECGAMKAVMAHHERRETPNLNKWLQHGLAAATRLEGERARDAGLSPHDRASQINVLVQLENLASYQIVRERVAAGLLQLHGWWFEVASGGMYAFDPVDNAFELVDRQMVRRFLKRPQRIARELMN